MALTYLFVGIGGVIGAILRYTVGLLFQHIWNGAFPLPTLTINPARQAGVDESKGSITQGKDADFVVLDDKCEVTATFVKGKKVYGA